MVKINEMYELKEPIAPYNALFDTENDLLRLKNIYYWDESVINSIG